MKQLKTVLFFGVAFLSFPVFLQAETATINVLNDAYIDDYSTLGILDGIPDRIGNTNSLLPAKGILSNGAAIQSKAIMAFDLNQFLGKEVTEAYLTGYGRRVDAWTNNDPILITFYHYADDGLVSLDDFTKSATYLNAVLLPNSGTFSEFLHFSINVTPVIQATLQGSKRFLEFRAEADSLSGYITAGEVPYPFSPDIDRTGPQLSITAIPEPASLLLFGLGGIALALQHRKRPNVTKENSLRNKRGIQ